MELLEDQLVAIGLIDESAECMYTRHPILL